MTSFSPASAADLLEKKIRAEIPAVRHFPFKIQSVSDTSVEVSARLLDHLNHKGTVFGGSLYQVALVAGYGMFLHLLESNGFNTRDFVIAKGRINYKLPVAGDFSAACVLKVGQIQDFCSSLRNDHRGDLILNSVVRCEGVACATFESRFVAFSPERPASIAK